LHNNIFCYISKTMQNEQPTIFQSLQQLTQSAWVKGGRSDDIERGIEAMQASCSHMLAIHHETDSENDRLVYRLLDRLQKIVKTHCIACMRQAPNEESVFTQASRWQNSNQSDGTTTMPHDMTTYLTEALHESLEIAGAIRGRGRQRNKGIEQLSAYHGINFTEELFHGNAIVCALRDVGLHCNAEEVDRIFSQGVRLRVAVHNTKNPLDAVRRIGKNVKEKLTDEKITEALAQEGITLDDGEQLDKLIPQGARLRVAVHNIANPLDAIRRIGKSRNTQNV